ncbi:hypothetical protein BSKO_00110 [Bryopsis sp. KO-2023]|nr:hypothetical protein BSKO_00110 [Bryopsis sp. KO-2023]
MLYAFERISCRGYRAREKVKILRRISKTREEQRQRRRKKREEAASICIQRHLRGHVARSHVRRIVDQNRRNSAARVIQACYQEYRARSLAYMLASHEDTEEGVQKTHKQANVQASEPEGNSEETIEADRCSLLSNDLVAECCSDGRGDGGCVDSVDTCSNEGEAAVGSDTGSDSSAPQLKPLILRSPGDGRLAPNIKDSFWFEKHPISAAGVRAHVRAVEMNLQEKDLREDLFERARKCCSQYQSSAEALKQLKLRRQTRSPPGAIPRVHVTSWRRSLP